MKRPMPVPFMDPVCLADPKTVFRMKKTTGLMLALLLLCSGRLFAQHRLRGLVSDSATGRPLPGATIRLDGPDQRGTASAADGRFLIGGLPPGQYTLQVQALGYAPSSRRIDIDGHEDNLHIALRNIGLFVAPVEISALRGGENAPFTKTTLHAADLEDRNLGQDLPYLLGQQPSVVTSSDAGAGVGYTGLWIRGSDATRINVTFNGIPVNDAESSGAFWVDFPDIASSTGSLQLQRGVGTSTNGAGAFGATLNLSTNVFHEDPYGELASATGSFHTWKHQVKAGSGLLNGHFTVDARLSSIRSDGYIDRASSDLKSFYFSTAYFAPKTSLRLNILSGKEKTYQAWNGVPADSLKTHRSYNGLGLKPDGSFYDNQTDNYLQTYYQLFLNREINADWDFNITAFLTRGRGYYEEYKQAQAYTDYGLEEPVIGGDTLRETDLIRDRWLDNDRYGGIFSLNHRAPFLSWSLGGGWDRYTGDHDGNIIWAGYGIAKDQPYYHNEADKNDLNLYWKGSKPLGDRLSAFLDLQYRHVRYNIYGFDHNPGLVQHNSYHFFNPKGGFSYRFPDQGQAYLSYAVAHKEPNRDDFEAGLEQTPRAERLGDLEAGYSRSGAWYAWSATVYYMHYHDQLVLTGKINDVGAYTRTNVPKSYRAGLELTGNLRFLHVFTLRGHAAFSRNRLAAFSEYMDNYDTGGQDLIRHGSTVIAFSPPVVGGAELELRAAKGLRFAVNGKYVGRRYLDNTSNPDRRLDAYWVSGLEAHWTLSPPWIKALDLDLLVNNLLDARYVSNGYTYSYVSGGEIHTDNAYFPQAGINGLLGLTLKL